MVPAVYMVRGSVTENTHLLLFTCSSIPLKYIYPSRTSSVVKPDSFSAVKGRSFVYSTLISKKHSRIVYDNEVSRREIII